MVKMIRAAWAAVLSIRQSNREGARWSAAAVFAVRAMSAVILFATQIVLARWMGASDYGIYVAAWTCVLVLGSLSCLGLSVASMRLAPQYQASGTYDLLRGLIRGGRRLAVGSATAIAVAGSLVLVAMSTWSGTPLQLAQLLALMCLPAYALTDVQDGLGRGQGWTLEAIAPPYLLRPLLVLVLLAAAHVSGFDSDAVSAMSAALLATLGAALVQSALIGRRISATVPPVAARYAVRSWLEISFPLLGVLACELVLQNADVLLLSVFRPSQELGIYYASVKTAALALLIQYAVGTAYAGRIAAASAISDHRAVRENVREAVRWTFIPSFAMTAAILILGLPVLAQFGHGFTDAYPLMFIVAVGVMARAAVGPSEVILNMLGQQRACAASLATAAAVSVGLNLLLIPLWGIYGAATATAAALVTAATLNWYAARRLLSLDLFVAANVRRTAKDGDDRPVGDKAAHAAAVNELSSDAAGV